MAALMWSVQPLDTAQNSIAVHWQHNLADELYEEILSSSSLGGPLKEVGGVLLGTIHTDRNGVQLTVRLFVPIPCSYQSGCLYHLSEEDKSAARNFIARCVSPQWPLIGIYRSNCRPGVELDDEDLKLAGELLKSPLGILLLVKPLETDGPLGGLFLLIGLELRTESALPLPFHASFGDPKLEQPVVPIQQPPSSDDSEWIAEGATAPAYQTDSAAKAGEQRSSEARGISTVARKHTLALLGGVVALLAAGLISVWAWLERNHHSPQTVSRTKPSF
jgi:hypothetical protein